MFGGFDPTGDEQGAFFERHRSISLLAALLIVGGGLGSAFWLASREQDEPVEEELVEVEIQDFEMEEELEEEEPEPEPPPPEPPSDKPVKRSAKPTPQPDIQNPDEIDEKPEEGEVDSEGPGYGEGGGGNNQGGGGTGDKPDEKPEEKPDPPKQKKTKKKKAFAYNPDKPIERPPEATVPKQVGGNAPVYPAELKKRNITGKVKVRLTIYKDGSVKGAKVLAKTNSIDKNAEPDLYDKANKLLLKAVAAAVRTWKFKPSTVEGKPISVYLTVTIPFTLN